MFMAAMLAGLGIHNMTISKIAPQTWPDAGPSEIFGMSTMPEPIPCPSCPMSTWLAQFVHSLDELAETPVEVRDVLANCYDESRYTPTVVSGTGDWGICQINARSWPDVDVQRLIFDPEYAAEQCLRVYRVYYRACGDKWRDCYRRGVRGGK